MRLRAAESEPKNKIPPALAISAGRSTMKSGREKVNCLYSGDLDHRL
jgi:hypothetical protein